jgi:hypothetical protein
VALFDIFSFLLPRRDLSSVDVFHHCGFLPRFFTLLFFGGTSLLLSRCFTFFSSSKVRSLIVSLESGDCEPSTTGAPLADASASWVSRFVAAATRTHRADNSDNSDSPSITTSFCGFPSISLHQRGEDHVLPNKGGKGCSDNPNAVVSQAHPTTTRPNAGQGSCEGMLPYASE